MMNTENLKEYFEDPDYENVFNQLGYEYSDLDDEQSVKDLIEDLITIKNYGVDSGLHGFTTHEDLIDFYDLNEYEVNRFVNEHGEDSWFEHRDLSDLLDTRNNTQFIEIAVWYYVNYLISLIDIDDLFEETEEDEE